MLAQAKEPAGAAPRFRIDLTAGVWGPLIGLMVLCVFFSLKAEHFFTLRNIIIIFDQVTVYGILAIGMTLVIITGGIDLSVGSVLAFSAMTTGWLPGRGRDQSQAALRRAAGISAVLSATRGLSSAARTEDAAQVLAEQLAVATGAAAVVLT